jgi:SMP-30/Gluconolactonase/LRE-like region
VRKRYALVIAGLLMAALALPVAAAGGAGAKRAPTVAGSATPPDDACAPWRVRTLLSGQGWLENLEFDGRGSISISALAQGRLLGFSRQGELSTLLDSVFAPGGQRRRGRWLYFNTGDTVPVTSTGTIDRLDLRTRERSTWARGLTMPNGLVFLPNGDAVVSRDLGTGTGLTRIPAHDPGHPQFEWAQLDDTNGLAVDPSGRWLYTDRTFSNDGEVDRVLISNPSRVEVVGRLGAGVFPDDLTVDRRGILYVAGFASGKIYRLNPRTHASCAIATGLTQPTSPRFGGPGWNARRLYVTDAAGHLSELTPPRRR